MVMIDKDGNPINRAYNLMDRRATKEVNWLKEHVGENRILELTAVAVILETEEGRVTLPAKVYGEEPIVLKIGER